MIMTCRAAGFAPAATVACAALLAPLLTVAAPAHAAAPSRALARDKLVQNFEAMAQHRPRKCTPDQISSQVPAPSGWQSEAPMCAWQGLLQMRRWRYMPANTPDCVSAPAQWWAWERQRMGATALPAVAWRAAWPSQRLAASTTQHSSMAIIEAVDGKGWLATEWTWSPSARAATRAWQQGRWQLLADATARHAAATPKDSAPDESTRLRNAWEKNLDGRPGEVVNGAWVWQADSACMRMTAVDPAEVQLALPYSPEDARQEQRAAMQIQLARRHPNATWLVPFRLLPLPGGKARAGAKYLAVWADKLMINGQLWIPAKTGSSMTRARIQVALPPKPATEASQAAIGEAIERELNAMATIWSATHER